MEDLLVPISICVVLPISIVWIIANRRKNEINRKSEVLIKAIESGITPNLDLFESNKKKSIKQGLLNKLTGAVISTLCGLIFAIASLSCPSFEIEKFFVFAGILISIGIGLFIYFFVGKHMLKKEIDKEEQEASDKE